MKRVLLTVTAGLTGSWVLYLLGGFGGNKIIKIIL